MGFEFQYKSLNFNPSCPDYPCCNYERELLYSALEKFVRKKIVRAWFALDFAIRHVGKTRYLVFEKRVVSLPNQKAYLQKLFCLACDFPSRKFSTGQVTGKNTGIKNNGSYE